MEELRTLIRQTMQENQREVSGHFYTVPSPVRYPFQWLWDSCFHALIYSALDETNLAKKELLSVCEKQHQSGLIPHISFWHDEKNPLPNWGRELRGGDINHIFGVTGSSSLTQPPLLAEVVLEVYKKTGDADFLKKIYPALVQFYEYLNSERTAENSLLFIVNPDESGEDNSPRFDKALGLLSKHSKEENLDKRLYLMEKLVACDFDTKTCMKENFAVIDVGFNCVYLSGLEALSTIAEILKEKDTSKTYANRAKEVQTDMKTLTTDNIHYYSFDHIAKEMISINTWNLFMPLYCGLLNQSEAEKLVQELFADDNFMASYGIRTFSKQGNGYDAIDGFWRGPVWMAPNYFIQQGLLRYGFKKEADKIKDLSINLIKNSGMREHYDPDSGTGYGAEKFTWAGLVLVM